MVVVPQPEPEKPAQRPAFPGRSIVLSDTDNDLKSVKKTLRFAGILENNGHWANNLQEITIFHTGDLIDKKNPDINAAKYWHRLKREARNRGGDVKLIVGNHEQEIWQNLMAGDKYGMDSVRAVWLQDFIENMALFHVSGPVLFIHGYPTMEFLRVLLHYKEVTGKDLNRFNADHYKKAFRSVKAIRQYAYVREKRGANYLLYDMANASRYYKKEGRAVAAVLAQLEIKTVIHGHRPQRSGVQVDYEFDKWIPNIRMIGNDTMVRKNGIGATVMKTKADGEIDVLFINTKTQSGNLRKKVRKDLAKQTLTSETIHPTDSAAPQRKTAAQR